VCAGGPQEQPQAAGLLLTRTSPRHRDDNHDVEGTLGISRLPGSHGVTY